MAKHSRKKQGKKQNKAPLAKPRPPAAASIASLADARPTEAEINPLQQLPQLSYTQTRPSKEPERRSSGPEEALDLTPMEYRAQIPGRCQRQFISEEASQENRRSPDVMVWLEEWVQGAAKNTPGDRLPTKIISTITGARITIQQRLISNSGIDADLIRPVLSSGGWPVIPGSSIKGVFRRECLFRNEPRITRWCGTACGEEPARQGLLRFNGAYPQDPEWKRENGIFSLDIAHPQWKWQLGALDLKHSAFAIISLLKPELLIFISSSDKSISEEEWHDIYSILKRGIQRQGIGGRTSAGYGTSGPILSEGLLFECSILGRGSASQLLSGKPEYRPMMFRAAIRSMALRVFGGLCDEETAERQVEILFGSVTGQHPRRGLLDFRYIDDSEPIIEPSKTRFSFPVFKASGRVQWAINPVSRMVTPPEVENIRQFLAALHGLVMSLGGFGRGWRRIDHEFFGRSLRHGPYDKAPIGCHWQWSNRSELPELLLVDSPTQLKRLLDIARRCAKERLGDKEGTAIASWQEVIHPKRMLIWTREADDTSDSSAMEWMHAKKQDPQGLPHSLCLHRTDMGGRLKNQRLDNGATSVSRIWHRMYPLQHRPENRNRPLTSEKPASNPAVFQRVSRGAGKRPNVQQAKLNFWNGPFLETLVLFPFNQHSPRLEMVPGAEALVRELDQAQGPASGFQRLLW